MGRKAIRESQRINQQNSKSLYAHVVEQGLDPLKLAHHTSVVYKLTDITEQMSLEIIDMLKGKKMAFRDAKDIKELNNISRRLQKSATEDLMRGAKHDGIDPDQYAENFGDSCDFMREVMELASVINDDNDRIKAISTLKLLAKKS